MLHGLKIFFSPIQVFVLPLKCLMNVYVFVGFFPSACVVSVAFLIGDNGWSEITAVCQCIQCKVQKDDVDTCVYIVL